MVELRSEKINLSEEEIPKKWYNLRPDLPEPLPPYKNSETGSEIKQLPEAYTKTASSVEFTDDRWIDIPDPVVDAYINCNRPRPLIRARRLEEFLKTPNVKIYYKCENLPPGGTFKTNTALAQAYWAMKEGCTRTVFAGSTTTRTKFIHVFAAKYFGLTPTLFLGQEECQQNKEQVNLLTKMFGADLVISPSNRTEAGRKFQKTNEGNPSRKSIIGAEVKEEATMNDDAASVLSSHLNHVLTTQTIIGLEIEKQLKQIDESPNILIAPVGGGSNFYGLTAPFVGAYLKKKLDDIKFLAVEPEISAKLTNGKFEYSDLKSVGGPMAGIMGKVYDTGEDIQKTIKGKGIQVRSTAPLLSFLKHLGILHTKVYPNDEKAIFDAAKIFLQTEGQFIAPESAYTIRAVIDEAREVQRKGDEKVIVASVSGAAYIDFGEKKAYSDLA